MAKHTKKEKKQKQDKKGKKHKNDKKLKAKSKRAGADNVRALAKRIVAMTTANDDDAAFEIYADDVESIEMNMPAMAGLDAIRAKFEGWRNMVTNPRFTAENVWVDGNTIIIEWIGDVTIAASGKQAQLREIAIHEIENGKIARERYYYDPAALQP
jgi:ketosteroid isomerase-like protein